jgi:hypothetical protein
MNIIKWIKKIFHRHQYVTIDILKSKNGAQVWTQRCTKCGKKRQAIFDANGACIDIWYSIENQT